MDLALDAESCGVASLRHIHVGVALSALGLIVAHADVLGADNLSSIVARLREMESKVPASPGAFPVKVRDELQRLEVYGWSRDGRYWAYSESGDCGCGALMCEMRTLTILNASGAPAARGLKYSYDDQAMQVSEPHARRKELAFRIKALEKLAVSGFGGNFGTEVFKTTRLFKGPVTESGIDWPSLVPTKTVSFRVGTESYRLKLIAKSHTEDQIDYRTRLSLVLTKTSGDGRGTTLATKETSFNSAAIVYASLTPDGARMAIVIAGSAICYEGQPAYYYLGFMAELPR